MPEYRNIWIPNFYYSTIQKLKLIMWLKMSEYFTSIQSLTWILDLFTAHVQMPFVKSDHVTRLF